MVDPIADPTPVIDPAANDPTPDPKPADATKTFTEDDLNRIVKERLDRERKKYSDYNDLKAAKSKLDEIEKAKLSDEEKAKKTLADLEAKIAEKEKALKDKALKDLLRDKIESAIADGKMKLPKGKTIASIVALSRATEEAEIDSNVEDLIGFFPPDEPKPDLKGIGTQTKTGDPTNTAKTIDEQWAEINTRLMDPTIPPGMNDAQFKQYKQALAKQSIGLGLRQMKGET